MANTYVRWPSSGQGVLAYANYAALPALTADGTVAVTLDTDYLYVFDLTTTTWKLAGGSGSVLSVGTFDSGTAVANGAHIDSNALIMQSATALVPGLVNIGSQTFAGVKTFNSPPVMTGITNSGLLTLPTGPTAIVGTDSAQTLTNKTINSTGNTISLAASTITSGTIATARGGTNANSSAQTGLALVTAGAWSWGALSGDITSSAFVTTLATVNSNVGTFGGATSVGTFTVNAKGLVTAASSTSIQIAESQVTNLVSDLAAKQTTTLTSGNILVGSVGGTATSVAMSGDATIVAGGALTLATVNTNTGSFGSSTAIPVFTVNGKGLITAASTAAVIAPAGTLTGTTLASNVVTSSLTAVGTIATGTWSATAIAASKGGTGVDSSAFTGIASVAAGVWSAGNLTGDVTSSARVTTLAATSNGTLTTLSALTTAASLATVGTITSGTWSATAIGPTKGGTGLASYALGDLLYASATNTLAALAGNITTTAKVLVQTGNGSVSAAPVWTTPTGTGTPVFSAAPTFSGAVTFAGSSVLDASGRLGIGKTPGLSLDISQAQAAGKFTSSTGTNSAYNEFTNTGGDMFVGVDNSTGNSLLTGGTAYAGVLTTAGATPLILGTNSVPRLTIDSSGKVGIGTAPATSLVTLAGNITANGSTGAVYYQASTSGSNTFVGAESSAGGSIFTGSSAYATVLGATSATALQFFTNNALRLTISSAGTPTFTGSPSAPTYNASGSGTAYYRCGGWDALSNPAGNNLALGGVQAAQFDRCSLYANASEGVRVSGAGATAFPNITTTASAANAFLDNTASNNLLRSTSSIRYKKNVTDLSLDSAKVYDLRPVEFDDKTLGTHHFGLIAEEVAEVYPLLVQWTQRRAIDPDSDSEEKVPDSVQYQLLAVLLLKELKKAKGENTSLAERLAKIEARLAALEG